METKYENISPQYLDKEQIKVYLEACLDNKVSKFEIIQEPEKDKETNKYKKQNQIQTIKEEFQKIKESKCFPDQDNLFYRVWVYQNEGLKELLETNPNKITNRNNTNILLPHNLVYDEKQKMEKDKKNLNFRFTFGKIDIFDLQRENVWYQKLKTDPNVNFDEYKPTKEEIRTKTEDLKIIFLYVNLGTPLLEEDLEVEEVKESTGWESKKKVKEKYKYKYEFDADRIVYFKKVNFSLSFETKSSYQCECQPAIKPEYYWVVEDKDNKDSIVHKYYCHNCFKASKDKIKGKIIENTKYSIRYFSYCSEPGHNTKKYEFYCKDCNRAYCVFCLTNEHKDLNKKHRLEDFEEMDWQTYNSFCKEKKERIRNMKKRNNEKWEKINIAGDNAERSWRERESKAIVDIKNEVLARCTFLTSIGYELQRIIGEIDTKKKIWEDMRRDSNIANYLNMNRFFVDDMEQHYLPNIEYIERIPFDKYLDTFHKIDKKYPMSNQKNDY